MQSHTASVQISSRLNMGGIPATLFLSLLLSAVLQAMCRDGKTT